MSECCQWPKLRLGDVLTVRHGKSQREVEVAYGPYPILATGGQIGWAQKPLYSEPSVLIGRKGTIDKPQYRAEPFWTVDTLFYTEISPAVDPRYLYFLFETIDWRSMNEASGVPSLSSSRIEGLEVYLPPLSEQVLIREYIDDVDNLIATLERLIAKKQSVKQGMMQQLLTGRTRLPGFEEEWAEDQLGNLVRFGKGVGLPKSVISRSGMTPCIHYGELFTLYGAEINDIESRTNTTSDFVYSEKLDVLMPTSAETPNGLAEASCIHLGGVALGGDILVIRPDSSRVYGPFLAHLIRYEVEQVLRLVTGSTVYHLYASDMHNFRMILPPIEEQQEIVSIFRSIEKEIGLLHQQHEKARAVKVGMMQQLLTGRVRLPVEENV